MTAAVKAYGQINHFCTVNAARLYIIAFTAFITNMHNQKNTMILCCKFLTGKHNGRLQYKRGNSCFLRIA